MDSAVFRTAYIVDRNQDYLWFIALPFAAVAFAVMAQHYLPGGALAAVTFWITAPHFFLTGVRLYASPLEFQQWRERLILSPILLIVLAFVLIKYAPLTLVLLVTLWDYQHSFMQQHGFARIYDYKARAGTTSTKSFDLAFNWVFFVNMLLVSPLFTTVWVRTLHEWRIPIGTETVALVQGLSWAVTALYGLVYIGHVIWCVRRGYPLNPLKYLFLFASYFLWYYISFTTSYLMVYMLAHRIMHGMQYNVIIYFFNRTRVERLGEDGDSAFLRYLAEVKNLKVFLLVCVVCTLVWIALTEGHMAPLGFGLASADLDLLSYSLVSSFAMIHYWYDAFIWKVRRNETQQGL
jgi:hypothetical protein